MRRNEEQTRSKRGETRILRIFSVFAQSASAPAAAYAAAAVVAAAASVASAATRGADAKEARGPAHPLNTTAYSFEATLVARFRESFRRRARMATGGSRARVCALLRNTLHS